MPAAGFVYATTTRKACGDIAAWLLHDYQPRGPTLLTDGEDPAVTLALSRVLSKASRRVGPPAFILKLDPCAARWLSGRAEAFALGWSTSPNAVLRLGLACTVALAQRRGGHNKLSREQALDDLSWVQECKQPGKRIYHEPIGDRFAATLRRRARVEVWFRRHHDRGETLLTGSELLA